MSDAPRQPAAPETDAIQQALDRIYMQCNTPTVDGHIYATTERAGHNRDTFAIAIVTTEGKIYSAGAVEEQFALQSISKVFSYGLALEDHGRDRVLEKVGVEPTGQRYNAINLHQSTGRPYNPMVNAGALAIADLIKGADITERLNRIIAAFSKYAGRRLLVDAPTFTFEFDTDHRNRAIAHLMAGQGVLEGKIDDVLYLYLQHCSLLVNTVELAAMAATFANSGVQPLTGERAIGMEHVRDVLSVMNSSGMYDSSGEWGYKVGLPAKSGVSGGIMAVVPGRMGIATFSPVLGEVGHSIRGVMAFESLSEDMNLHIFDCC